MAAYLFLSYDISDPEKFAGYNPGSLPTIMQTLQKHGGNVLGAGTDNHWVAGERATAVLLEFPTVEAAEAWEADPDYQAAKAIRLASTTNRFEVIVPQFVPPSG